jgi:hypothetical protein
MAKLKFLKRVVPACTAQYGRNAVQKPWVIVAGPAAETSKTGDLIARSLRDPSVSGTKRVGDVRLSRVQIGRINAVFSAKCGSSATTPGAGALEIL